MRKKETCCENKMFEANFKKFNRGNANKRESLCMYARERMFRQLNVMRNTHYNPVSVLIKYTMCVCLFCPQVQESVSLGYLGEKKERERRNEIPPRLFDAAARCFCQAAKRVDTTTKG